MKAITIKELYELCKEQVEEGNGNKTIMLSNDDEGNGYHYMWYTFSTVEQAWAKDYIDERIAKEEDTIILG